MTFIMCLAFLGPRCHSLLALTPGVTVVNRLPPPSTQGLSFPKPFRHTPTIPVPEY